MKKNVKFFAKLILALAPLICLVLYTLLCPFGYMDREYPSWLYSKDVITGKVNPFGSDGPTAYAGSVMKGTTVILGDSRAMAALDPDEFKGTDCVNLAVGGGTSIEMYYTLKEFVENVGVPERAVIMFAPFHYSVIDNFNERTLYFNYLTVPEMKEVYDNAKEYDASVIIGDNPDSKQYIEDFFNTRLRTPMKYLPALINSRAFGRYSENKATYEELKEKRGHDQFGEADGCSDLNYETSYTGMHMNGNSYLLLYYFDLIIKECNENNIDFVVAVPPMNESSYNSLDPSYVEDFYAYFDVFSTWYPRVKFDPEIIPMEDEYFGDSSHLNKKGAKKYTEYFCEKYGF